MILKGLNRQTIIFGLNSSTFSGYSHFVDYLWIKKTKAHDTIVRQQHNKLCTHINMQFQMEKMSWGHTLMSSTIGLHQMMVKNP